VFVSYLGNDVREPLSGFRLHVCEQFLLGVVRNILLYRILTQALVQVIGKLNDRGEALRDKGLSACKVSGILSSAHVIEREIEGRKAPYLNVTLKDEDGKYLISVALAHSGAKMLARKMVNAEPGVNTEISMFATSGQKEGAARAYANHGATVRQHGKEVLGINPKDSLVPQVNAAIEALTPRPRLASGWRGFFICSGIAGAGTNLRHSTSAACQWLGAELRLRQC